MKIIVVSGGFDPLHSGHITYFKAAKERGDKLIVAINSDDWLARKKGKCFMPFDERKALIENLCCVDLAIDFEDDEHGSAKNALKKVKGLFPDDKIFFANGGDRDGNNILEMDIKGVEFLFGIGGNHKMNSSSSILKNWRYFEEGRKWGHFVNLFEEKQVKVKELVIDAGKNTSFQRHFKRSEIWFVSQGACMVKSKDGEDSKIFEMKLNKFDDYHVSRYQWHQILNPFNDACHIIEIQYGDACYEEDIERIT
tara:strand:- start:1595 stop:2353 length:759 start_codon:yes stop_codon:yes gene_type:complete